MKQPKVEVISMCDRHDQQWFLEVVGDMASNGGAHIYAINLDGDFGPTFLISNHPLSPTEVGSAYKTNQLESAREALKSGDSPEDVWNMYAVSAADINRIAGEEKITLSSEWFEQARKEVDIVDPVTGQSVPIGVNDVVGGY